MEAQIANSQVWKYKPAQAGEYLYRLILVQAENSWWQAWQAAVVVRAWHRIRVEQWAG